MHKDVLYTTQLNVRAWPKPGALSGNPPLPLISDATSAGIAPLLLPSARALPGAAPPPGCCWALPARRAELRPSVASPGCVTDACHAAVPCLNWPGLRWVCTAPLHPPSPAPASPAEPSLAQPPAMCSALSSPSWKGSTTLSAPPDFLCFCHTEAPSLWSSSSCACLSVSALSR